MPDEGPASIYYQALYPMVTNFKKGDISNTNLVAVDAHLRGSGLAHPALKAYGEFWRGSLPAGERWRTTATKQVL
jgi:hypothetical protein